MLTITTAALAAVAILVTLLVINRRDRRALTRTTAQLAESEARLRQVAETVPAGIFHIDADGRRIYVNPRLIEITGDSTTAPGAARTWLVHEDDKEMLSSTWTAATAARSDVKVTFRINRMNDGVLRWVHVDARPSLDADGNVDGWIGSTVDVTEETTSIAELRRFSEILEATPDPAGRVN